MTRDRLRVAAAAAILTLLGSAGCGIWLVASGSQRAAAAVIIAALVALAVAVVVGVLTAAALSDLEDLRAFLAAPDRERFEALPDDLRAAAQPSLDRTSQLTTLTEQLDELAVRDADTGVLTAREIDHRLLAEVDRVRRHGGEVSVLLVEIDGLADTATAHGRDAAVELLRGVAVVLETTARPSDIVGRMGDGFVVILPHATPDGARAAAERFVTTALETTMVTELAGTTHVGVRVGVATFPGEASSPGDLLVAAREGVERARGTVDRIVRARG